MRSLTRAYFDQLIAEGLYTSDQVAALEDPTAECSWRPDLERLAGPLPTMAVSAGQVACEQPYMPADELERLVEAHYFRVFIPDERKAEIRRFVTE